MKRSALFSSMLLLLVACDQSGLENNEVDPINPKNPTQVESQGKELYQIWCAECHGEEGEGSEEAFQIQNPIINYASFVIRNGRETFTFEEDMPAFDTETLRDDEVNAILFFLRQAPKPTTGAGLFGRFCANCHGANADGGVVGVSAVEEAQDKPEEVLETVREGEGESAAQRFEYMPKFSQEDLSNAEVEQITDFLLSL